MCVVCVCVLFCLLLSYTLENTDGLILKPPNPPCIEAQCSKLAFLQGKRALLSQRMGVVSM